MEFENLLERATDSLNAAPPTDVFKRILEYLNRNEHE